MRALHVIWSVFPSLMDICSLTALPAKYTSTFGACFTGVLVAVRLSKAALRPFSIALDQFITIHPSFSLLLSFGRRKKMDFPRGERTSFPCQGVFVNVTRPILLPGSEPVKQDELPRILFRHPAWTELENPVYRAGT